MRYRHVSRKPSLFIAGSILATIALFFGWIALSLSIGAWSVQYVVSFWTLYLTHVAKHVPYLPAAVAGVFLSELTIPAAIMTWVLSFVL